MNATETRESLKETGATINTAFAGAAHDLRRLRSTAEDKIEETRHTIRMNPLASVAIIASAGLVLGIVIGWTGKLISRN